MLPFVLAAAIVADESLWASIKARHDTFQDVELLYEGEQVDIDRGVERLGSPFTGRGGYHRAGVFFRERHIADERGITKDWRSARRNGLSRWREHDANPRIPPAQWIDKTSWGSVFDYMNQFVYLWPIPVFDFFSDTVLATKRHVGSELIEGRAAQAFELREGNYVWHFWFDLERDGNVVRVEEFEGPERTLVYRTHAIRLVQFTDRRGHRVWFPTSGLRDVFWKSAARRGEVIYSSSPTTRFKYRIVGDSLRLNVGKPPEQFEVPFDNRYGFLDRRTLPSQEKPAQAPTLGAISADSFRQMLDQAKSQATQLEAERRRPPDWWIGWASWTLAAIGLGVALGAMWMLRRARGG